MDTYCTYNKSMQISYDTAKRDKTLAERGRDFADAAAVFAGVHLTLEDHRQDYGEIRFISVGLLCQRMVVMVWTLRGAARRIISMRKANEREQTLYRHRLG
jgi:uncharacterized DUF497 family protein